MNDRQRTDVREREERQRDSVEELRGGGGGGGGGGGAQGPEHMNESRNHQKQTQSN